MSKFFTRERFGQPQFLAGLLLLAFLGQCLWLVMHGTHPLGSDSSERFRIEEGLLQWRGESVAGTPTTDRTRAGTFPPPEVAQNEGYDPNHSPLWYLLASVTRLQWHRAEESNPSLFGEWLLRLPYIIFGILLGASLWYVSRRLYGNAGGYIALTLYCFSPAILRSSTLWFAQPEMGAAWGTFGAIFTAIAVAHTLYAPREVVLWNWRRILLLGLSLALAIGCQFSLVVLLPVTLAFMLYVAPTRRAAVVVIWVAACAVATVLIFAAYAFHMDVFWQGIRHADFFGGTWRAFGVPRAYRRILGQIGESGPSLLAMLPAALVVYFGWKRARYFGNTAPLLMAALFLVLGVAHPHYPGEGFLLMAVPFLLVFVAGMAADMLETPQGGIVQATIWGLLTANSLWNLAELARVARR